MRRTTFIALLLLVPQGGPRAQAGQDSKQPESPAATVARTEIDRGLIKVSVEVQPHPVRLSDEPVLTLTIDSQRGVEVEKPPFGEAIGSFVIREFCEPLLEARDDREIRRQVYTLEPTRTGKLAIEPITVAFTDRRPQGDQQRHTVETEALAIEVTSSLESDAPTLDDLKPASGPIELPEPHTGAALGSLGVFLLALVAAVGFWLWRRRRRERQERPLSPLELAYLELDALLRENLSQTDLKLFYVRLTAIVRRYIERTTGIHAPEQTTEEFLREIGTGQVFSGADRERLKAFLESADLVKFAAQRPSSADVEETFHRAQAFLGLQRQEVAA